MLFPTYNGIKICTDLDMVVRKRVQVRFPKSKKFRINKKWAKKYGKWVNIPHPGIVQVAPGMFVCHPETLKKLENNMERANNEKATQS